MRSFFKKIHILLSIPIGLLFSFACITGSLLVFQNELLEMSHPSRYYLQTVPEGERLSLDTLVARTNRQLSDDSIVGLQLHREANRTVRATLSQGHRSYLYLNPYSGEITGRYLSTEGFFAEVKHLHRWFLFQEIEQGRRFTGWLTILFIVILVTGTLIAFPKSRTRLSSLLVLRWRGKNTHQRLFNLHKVVGFYLVAGLLFLSLTGLMWSFKGYRTSVTRLFGLETSNPQKESSGKRSSERAIRNEQKRPIAWEQCYRAAKEVAPEAKEIRITSGEVSILPADARHERALDQYHYNPHSKKVELKSRFGELRNERYAMTWAYLLHTGTWGGAWSKWITFAVALIGATLPLTGYYLFLRKHKKKKKRTRATSRPKQFSDDK